MRAPVFLLVILSVAAVALAKEPAPQKKKKKNGRALFLVRCATCHDPGRVTHRVASADEWREVVYRMQRMPQSGIRRAEADAIINHLMTFGRKRARSRKAIGGRRAYGKEWLSILETVLVTDGAVTLGRSTWKARVEGLTVFLRRGKKIRTVALTADGKPAATALVDTWRIGETRYELHWVLYRVSGAHVRVARALRRIP